ncbi:hypothetical protein M422DRAFT_263823 [Sphaerobolus stellatus SS14]|uniref:Uncharacterized protein n=1 Tax=Sphaerobolus stellatus (strain SS14) TaxID=990650 RepID=A0A0C9UXY5_SPHS4|nr:hypothetical protein M422DRAFT_263823 [Sphaerobolus stellatus SS14]
MHKMDDPTPELYPKGAFIHFAINSKASLDYLHDSIALNEARPKSPYLNPWTGYLACLNQPLMRPYLGYSARNVDLHIVSRDPPRPEEVAEIHFMDENSFVPISPTTAYPDKPPVSTNMPLPWSNCVLHRKFMPFNFVIASADLQRYSDISLSEEQL